MDESQALNLSRFGRVRIGFHRNLYSEIWICKTLKGLDLWEVAQLLQCVAEEARATAAELQIALWYSLLNRSVGRHCHAGGANMEGGSAQ